MIKCMIKCKFKVGDRVIKKSEEWISIDDYNDKQIIPERYFIITQSHSKIV